MIYSGLPGCQEGITVRSGSTPPRPTRDRGAGLEGREATRDGNLSRWNGQRRTRGRGWPCPGLAETILGPGSRPVRRPRAQGSGRLGRQGAPPTSPDDPGHGPERLGREEGAHLVVPALVLPDPWDRPEFPEEPRTVAVDGQLPAVVPLDLPEPGRDDPTRRGRAPESGPCKGRCSRPGAPSPTLLRGGRLGPPQRWREVRRCTGGCGWWRGWSS